MPVPDCPSNPKIGCRSFKKSLEFRRNRKKVGKVDIELGEDIGQGTFGIVKEIKGKEAVEKSTTEFDSFVCETGAMNALVPSKHVLPIYDETIKGLTQQELYFPRFANSLASLLGKLTPFEKIDYAFQLADGLHTIVNHGIYHLDIKPDNILIKNGYLAIGDFGNAFRTCDAQLKVPSKLRPMFGRFPGFQTLLWSAPEILWGYPYYDHRVDVWSLGIILLQINGRQNPIVMEDSEESQLNAILALTGLPDDLDMIKAIEKTILLPHVSYRKDNRGLKSLLDSYRKDNRGLKSLLDSYKIFGELRELVLGMLEVNPHKRLTIDQVVSHPYFQGRKPSEPVGLNDSPVEQLHRQESWCLAPRFAPGSILQEGHRLILVDWIHTLKDLYTLPDQVFFLAINLLDAYDQKKPV
ncbi:MAG: protein kinase domain-containing protein, partial [Sulfobacillus sp.]